MNTIKIGIICPSEIAYRRFMPALKKCKNFEYIGVAYPNSTDWNNASAFNLQNEKEKAENFQKTYGGEIFSGYKTLITSNKIDAIYLPLPPGLHYFWAKKALENNKHVFLEKPSTTCIEDTKELVGLAKNKGLALHENYMFQYHNQIEIVKKSIEEKKIGEVRLIRANFGFPKRAENDFRYNKKLGGGALLDCAGYPVKLMTLLLGNSIKVDSSILFYNHQDIDLYGSVQMSSHDKVAQISFGMDNSYKCDLEIWGSKGTISTNRIFTAPEGFKTEIVVNVNNEKEIIHVDGDDTFYKSIKYFYSCIMDFNTSQKSNNDIIMQSQLVEEIRKRDRNR